jgi:hypothetical protein
MQLIKIEPPKPLPEAASKSLNQQLAQQMQADIVAQYVSDLQKRMGVSINNTLVDQTTGASIPGQY